MHFLIRQKTKLTRQRILAYLYSILFLAFPVSTQADGYGTILGGAIGLVAGGGPWGLMAGALLGDRLTTDDTHAPGAGWATDSGAVVGYALGGGWPGVVLGATFGNYLTAAAPRSTEIVTPAASSPLNDSIYIESAELSRAQSVHAMDTHVQTVLPQLLTQVSDTARSSAREGAFAGAQQGIQEMLPSIYQTARNGARRGVLEGFAQERRRQQAERRQIAQAAVQLRMRENIAVFTEIRSRPPSEPLVLTRATQNGYSLKTLREVASPQPIRCNAACGGFWMPSPSSGGSEASTSLVARNTNLGTLRAQSLQSAGETPQAAFNSLLAQCGDGRHLFRDVRIQELMTSAGPQRFQVLIPAHNDTVCTQP